MMQHRKSVFVFGSNLAGIHGAGAAKEAFEKYGAVRGQGRGRQGRSYAIPTKDKDIYTALPLTDIEDYVKEFRFHAGVVRGDNIYILTPIGTGYAGYSHEDMYPLFRDMPDNVMLPYMWAQMKLYNQYYPNAG